ncbi:Rieske 2Fe-2S domain-containing protein [Pedobacter africanus]|nr:Rieske 2Fe-2S domain-containing protein [Pedobacter africanus]
MNKNVEHFYDKVMDYEGKKLAVHKDDAGKVTALNPTCTHAGCTVQFNAAEQSWDCPCHGGRFDVSRKALTGPPTIDLETVFRKDNFHEVDVIKS